MRAADEAFEKQLECENGGKSYKVCCAVCGKAKSQKKRWFQRLDKTLRKLRFMFACCDVCGKWVCEDCFCIDDGNGNGIGICTACAKEQGITGLNGAQFEEAWPELQKRIWARNEAVRRAVTKEKGRK